MNAILLYPRFPDTFWSLRHALKFIRKQSAMPPLGLLTIAAMLPREWNLRLIDTNVVELSDQDLAWADIVMISGMAVQKESARQLIARCAGAGVKLVAGGPLFTAQHEEFPSVDHFVLNEAELTLAPFLADLQNGTAKRMYTSQQFADLTKTPVPLWSLLDIKRYGVMGVQYSRGCPFNCEFCDVTALLGRNPRVKSPAQIIAELDGLREAGWRWPVFFVDDNLVGNKKAVRTELLPALIQWQGTHRGTSFNTQASINIADDPELMQLMVAAGFDTIFVGIETPNLDSLAECRKLQNKDRDLVADVKKIQRAGMQVQGGFIVGFDNDDPSIFARQIDFIQKSGIVTAMVGLLQAMPGTALHERMRREGRLRGSGTGDNVDGSTNIIPARMSLKTLREGYQTIVRSIYSPRHYYRRVRTFLREFHRPKIRTGIDRIRLFAFFRSLVYLGVLGRERMYYWHLLIWTLLRRPRLFPDAVSLAISGHHFRRTCEKHIQ
jgi:radical SAM superfamily enzyme YgiQ (UPF0313 family)